MRALHWALALSFAAMVAGRPQLSDQASMFPGDAGKSVGARDGWEPSDYTPNAQADRVKELPGAPAGQELNLFAGYVTVDADAGRSLFYTFVEASRSPRTAPLVLWLNGGPGCSSLGGGFLSELGPFYPTPGGKELVPNKHAWNSVANMLFLESPAGVGFSYTNTTADLTTGDARTAADSRAFLLGWLERFPQYREHKFWLSGESYAGHYVPNLAAEILRGNKEGNEEERINLQGFLVGNAWTHAPIDNKGAVAFWWSHGIVSTETRHGIDHNCDWGSVGGALAFWWSHGIVSTETRDGALRNCDFDSLYPLAGSAEAPEDLFVAAVEGPTGAPAPALGSKEAKCDRFVQRATEEMGGINIYDIYADVCLSPPAKQARQLGLMLRDHPAGASTRPLLAASPNKAYDPCIDSSTEAFLNRPDVQAALHANVSGELPGPWQDCTQRVLYSRKDLLSSMLPVYRKLLKEDIQILVYSGDVDAIVPVIGTRNWIRSLDLPIVKPWRAWRSKTGQVGGWTVEHEGLTFASVRGAGHMVPYTQPERALHLFRQWVHQEPL